ADAIGRFFESAALRGSNDPMFRHATGTCRFDVLGVGSWLVQVDQGTISVSEAQGPAPADSVLTASENDFLRMARGEQNPLTTFMQGRLQVTGHLPLAERFLHLFP